MIEKWQTGPVPGFDPMLMPVVHSLLQVKAEIDDLLTRVTEEHVWARPGGAASIGFHLLHIGGSSARLLTYARGERLSPEQLADARSEVAEHATRHAGQALTTALVQGLRD